ncbi:hypothetical protein [Flavobacterium laiguense]|uniref:Uncharacterized protein n=1 Tax=Flavobacterium laiguense TaxID=2169409 RepID=A0A2U1K2C8_9FLAO|nr:hypothetical protein [Flavobacterium laiguense]PWA11657.1 hypothetical protein DB891_02300 [Flavobacterium laiguense]
MIYSENLSNYFKGFNIEGFEMTKQNLNLSEFNFEEDMVLFFDIEENNHFLGNYLKSNYHLLFERFTKIDKKFIYLSKIQIQTDTIEEIIKYYLPHLNYIKGLLSSSLLNSTYCKTILNSLGYNGNIQSGFLLKKDNLFYLIECDDLHFSNLNLKPFERLFEFLNEEFITISNSLDNLAFSRREFQKTDPFEGLDEETVAKIKQIEAQLKDLKNNGQLLYALPILKNIINNTADEIDLKSVSKINIDTDFRISLPYFGNVEIPLSHLTKSIYILFYNHPEGINIKQLHLYKKELEQLYSKISYQADYDKMLQSIDDLTDLNSKAIYTHISRIKSAFYKLMDKQYADNYIISGSGFGSDVKRIPILKPKENEPETYKGQPF